MKILQGIISGDDVPFAIPNKTMGQLLFQALCSDTSDDILAIEFETEKSITVSEFLCLSIKIAKGLKECGLRPGDVVGMAGKNGIELSAASAAVLYLGGTVAPIDPNMKQYELQEIMKIIEPKLVFCDVEVTAAITEALSCLKGDIPIVLLCCEPGLDYAGTKLEDLTKNTDMANFQPVPSEDTSKSIAFLGSSSGTMGLPKAIMLSDRAMVFQLLLKNYMDRERNIVTSTLLHTSHFFWITGCQQFLSSTYAKQRRIIVRDMSVTNIVNAIEKHRAELCLLVPSHICTILSSPDFHTRDLSSVKSIKTCGTFLDKSTIDSVKEKWPQPVRVSQGYGCTELAGVIATVANDEDVASVGRLIPGSHMKVVNVVTKEICGPGEEGELCFKSPSLMNGYVKNEEATSRAIDEDGWLHTGDIGCHKDGLVYVFGRIKELIKYMNTQIAPVEVEEVIRMVPGVLDVGVVGIRVDVYNSHVTALVVRATTSDVTEEDVIKCVKGNLSEYKQLRGGVYFVEEIPRTPTGKIRRKELQTFAETLVARGASTGLDTQPKGVKVVAGTTSTSYL